MTGQAVPIEVGRVVKLNGDGAVKAICDLKVADQFLVRGFRVIEGKRGVFVSMPRQQNRDGAPSRTPI